MLCVLVMSFHALLHKTSLLALFLMKALVQSSKYKEGKGKLTPSWIQKRAFLFVEFAFVHIGFFALILENYGKILDLNNAGDIKTFAFKRIEKIISQHPPLIETTQHEVNLNIDGNQKMINFDNEQQTKSDFSEAKRPVFLNKFNPSPDFLPDVPHNSALLRIPIYLYYCCHPHK